MRFQRVSKGFRKCQFGVALQSGKAAEELVVEHKGSGIRAPVVWPSYDYFSDRWHGLHFSTRVSHLGCTAFTNDFFAWMRPEMPLGIP